MAKKPYTPHKQPSRKQQRVQSAAGKALIMQYANADTITTQSAVLLDYIQKGASFNSKVLKGDALILFSGAILAAFNIGYDAGVVTANEKHGITKTNADERQ